MAAIVQIFQHYVIDCSPEEPGISTLNSRHDTNYICHYMHCLALLKCNPPQEICFFRKCGNCPTNESFKELITEAFDRKGQMKLSFVNGFQQTGQYRKKLSFQKMNLTRYSMKSYKLSLHMILWQKCRWHFYETRKRN